MESSRLQQAKRATSAKHLASWDWSVFECTNTNAVFFAIFLILVVRTPKGPQALMAKPATTFPEIVYITVILSYVSASNCSLNHLNL